MREAPTGKKFVFEKLAIPFDQKGVDFSPEQRF